MKGKDETRKVWVRNLGEHEEGSLVRVFASAEGMPGGTEALVELKGDGDAKTAFVWARDPMEAAGIPLPRPPWSKLSFGLRWVPLMVVDSVDHWTPAGAEWTELDPLGIDEALHQFARRLIRKRLGRAA